MLAQVWFIDKKRDGIEAAFDFLGSGQRRRQALGEQAAARRRDSLVDGCQQGPVPRAGQGAREFEIGSRRGIDFHPRAGGEPRRQAQRRAGRELGTLDVENRGGGGGEFGAGKGAQSVQRREPEIVLNAALGTWPRSPFAAKRGPRKLRLSREPRKARKRAKRFRSDDFGRIEARNLGFEGSLRGLGDDEGAGRDIDAREPVG